MAAVGPNAGGFPLNGSSAFQAPPMMQGSNFGMRPSMSMPPPGPGQGFAIPPMGQPNFGGGCAPQGPPMGGPLGSPMGGMTTMSGSMGSPMPGMHLGTMPAPGASSAPAPLSGAIGGGLVDGLGSGLGGGSVAHAGLAMQPATAPMAQATTVGTSVAPASLQPYGGAMGGCFGGKGKDQQKAMPAFRSSFVMGRPAPKIAMNIGGAFERPPGGGGPEAFGSPGGFLGGVFEEVAPVGGGEGLQPLDDGQLHSSVAAATASTNAVVVPAPPAFGPIGGAVGPGAGFGNDAVPGPPPVVVAPPEVSRRDEDRWRQRIEDALETFLGQLPAWRGGQRDVCRSTASASPDREGSRSRGRGRRDKGSRSRSRGKRKDKKDMKDRRGHRDGDSRSPSRKKKKDDKKKKKDG